MAWCKYALVDHIYAKSCNSDILSFQLFGLVTVVMWVTQVALGGGSVWFNGSLFGGNPKAKLVWKYHR